MTRLWMGCLLVPFISAGVIATESQPEPRRTQSVTEAPSQAEQEGNPEQEPASDPAAAPQPFKTEEAREQAVDVPAHNEQQPQSRLVTVGRLPAVDVQRDWFAVTQIATTAVPLVFAVWQLKLLRKTLKATEQAADAAKATSIVAERALAITERAYLAVGPWELPDGLKRGGFHVRCTLANVGRTPARAISALLNVRIAAQAPVNAEYVSTTPGLSLPHLLMQGGRFGLLFKVDGLTEDKFDALVNRATEKMFLWGRISYLDSLNVGITHHRRFAVMYDPVTEKWSSFESGHNDEVDEGQAEDPLDVLTH